IDVAFLPVETAYVRVLAAQEAIDRGDLKVARQILSQIPVVSTELQIAAPLVPIRFNLSAAALAAEQGNWDRSRTLVRAAATELQKLEPRSKGTPAAEEMGELVDDMQQLQRQMGSDDRPEPREIRELAQRTREIGEDIREDMIEDRGEKRG